MRSFFKNRHSPENLPRCSDQKGHKLNALVVESDERFLKKLISMAQTARMPEESGVDGIELTSTSTLRDAIDTLEERCFDIILTDINLSDATGFLVIEELLEFGEATPIIVLSNITKWDTIMKSAKAGINDFLLKKTLDADLLMRSIFYAIERKSLESKVTQSEALYRSLVEILPLGLIRTDYAGELNYVNQACAEIAGEEPESMLGRTLESNFKGDAFAKVRLGIRNVLDDGRNFETELSKDDPELGLRHFHFVATPIRDERERVTGAQCLLMDVSHQKKIQEELDTARSLNTLQSGISKLANELNNAIATIVLDTENLISTGIQSIMAHPIRRIEHSVEKVRSVLRPFLVSSQKVGPRSELLDFRKILNHAVESFRSNMPSGVQIETQTETQTGSVLGDASLLHKMVLHLLNNAAESMPKGGVVILRAQTEKIPTTDPRVENLELKPETYLRLTIIDQGEGIAPHMVQRIFEPFYTTKKKPHAGTGLTEVLGVIKGHNGNIHVESQVGTGTEVRLYLPVQKDRPTAIAAKRPVDGETQSANRSVILLVDDEEDILSSAEMLIKRLGYEVLLALNGAEALSLFNQRKADIGLIITDFDMPIMDGADLVKAIRQISPSVRIVLCTGMESQDNIDQVSGLSIDETLFKPFSGKSLKNVIEHLLIQ